MTGIAIKAKKGDAIVIETLSSSTSIKDLKVSHYSYFKIAKCVKADRQGRVIQYETPTTYAAMLDKNQRVICISDPDKQEAAKRLYAKVKDNWFDKREDIQRAVLEA